MFRVAFIGFGGIAHSNHINPQFELVKEGKTELVAVCDIRPNVFDEAIAINIGIGACELPESVKRYTDYKEMLAKEDIDIVIVCVPTFLHAEVAIYALETGHHVLCEKPMSLRYEDCVKMCEAEQVEFLTLEVRVSNQSAIALYEKNGFLQVNIKKAYYKDNYEDASYMVKPLGVSL